MIPSGLQDTGRQEHTLGYGQEMIRELYTIIGRGMNLTSTSILEPACNYTGVPIGSGMTYTATGKDTTFVSTSVKLKQN